VKLAELEKIFITENTNEIEFEGICNDCKKEVLVEVLNTPEGITIMGGAIYRNEIGDFLKCDACFSLDPILRNYQPVQNYSRCVGYMRPVNDWNPGKQEEFRMRKTYSQPSLEALTQ